MTRLLLALCLLALPCCDGQAGPSPGKQDASKPDSVAAVAGTWILDPEAVHAMVLRQTRADMVSEGMDVKKLNEKQLAAVKSSAAGCTRTLVLSADGTFTSDMERDVPGEQFKEQAEGTWKALADKVVLTIERVGGERLDQVETEELLEKGGTLEAYYYDHPVPMIRQGSR